MKRTLIIGAFLSLSNGASAHRALNDTDYANLSNLPLYPHRDDAHPSVDKDGHIIMPDDTAIPNRRRGLRTPRTRQSQQQRRRHLTSGTFHNLVLLLKFANHVNRPLPPRKHYDLLYNSPSTSQEIIPTGSVKSYFRTNSYGAFNVETTVLGWIELSHSESYYANGDYGFVKLQEAIVEALEWVQDNGYDFNDFDSNGDGVVDGFGLLISGYGAEFAGADCDGAENVNRIWSHKGGVDWTSSNNVTVDRYYVSSGLRNKCGSDIARMGVICHELGHYLGLPDLYDNTFEGSGIGAFDVMSQSWGFDGSGVYPPLLSAWSKVSVGWVTPTLIEEDGTYELENSETSDEIYRIDAGFPEGEFLLLENRQPDGYDSKIPHGGIAIWHIDEKATQNTRGYPGQELWPENGQHYRVALIPADGNYHLEKGVNQGDAHDLWHASSAYIELKSGGGQYPNTDSYQDGLVTKTEIKIYGFSPSNQKMTFTVTGLGTKPPTIAPSKILTASPTQHRVTDNPTKLPTAPPSRAPKTQSPVTSDPTRTPSTSHPTRSPLSELQRCTNRCFKPILSSECPINKSYINCKFSYIGSICYSEDNECGAHPNLDNCNGFSVYKRVNCSESDIDSWSVDDTTSDTPLNSPTSKPTVLYINGGTTYTSTGSDESSCNYYPGWLTGLTYCLNDCEMPKPNYMDSNPLYEFKTLDLCCDAHYQGKEGCKRTSLDTTAKIELVSNTAEVQLAYVSGHVWKDLNGNHRRDSSETELQGAIVDLYECDFNTWVKGTKSSADGSYILSRLPPGKYSLKVTAPDGFHFIFDQNYWRNEDLDPTKATTPCYDLRPLEENAHFDVGIVPDAIAVTTDQGAAVDQPELKVIQLSTNSKTASAIQVSNNAVASHSKSSRPERPANKPNPVPKEQVHLAPDNEKSPFTIQEQTGRGHSKTSLHSKSYVDKESTVRIVNVQPIEGVTISQNEIHPVGKAQELRVSKYEDILLKFDISSLQGKPPSSAVLRLYSLSSSPVGGSVYRAAHNMWNVDIVTWEDAPDADEVLNNIGSTYPNEWVEVDVTDAMPTHQEELVSFRIKMSPTRSHWNAKYSSKNVQLRLSF